MDVCDPDAKTKNIRKLIKLHTGKTIKISRDKVCDIMKDVDRGKLPLPPLVLTRDKRYLLDPKSPLTWKDFETLFKSSVTSKVVKRLAKKVGLIETDKTISDLKRAIGRKLMSMNIREPVLLPGSHVYPKVKSKEFRNEETPVQIDENRNRGENRDENRNRGENRDENRNRGENRDENRNRGENRDENRNRGENRNKNRAENRNRVNNTSNSKLQNTLARKRHMDRMKQMSKGGIYTVPDGSSKLNSITANRRKLNMNVKMENLKLNTNRRVQEQKRNFNRRSSEKQVIEERRKRREALIIETKVRNGRRAEINAKNRARRAEAATNREYENKKRAQLKANINSQRVKSLEKNYTNLKTKTTNTLNKYTLRKKLADTQMSNSSSKVRALDKKLKYELDRADIEREMGKKLQSDLNAVALKVEKSEQRVREIEEERGELNTRIKDLQSRLETQAKNGTVVEAERLTKELNEAKVKIEKLTSEVSTLTNSTNMAVASATKDLNTKLALAVKNKNNAVIASNAVKKKAALSEAKYKAARSEMNLKNEEKTHRELNSKLRKRVKLNGLLTNIGVTNKTVLMNEYNSAIKNGKDPNETIDKIVKEARLLNKETARTSAALAATAVAKISMQSELNDIRTQKEEALAKAATEKNAAVAEARNAARTAAMAETATEKAAAEQKLKNAQAKINAANANKAQALANAKTERNTALKRAMNNKQKAVNGLRANRNLKLQNKNAALMGAARNANAAKKELNAIREQKEAALAKAATEKNAAVAEARNAARTAAMAETATEKAAAEQKLKNAQNKINAANANKAQALANAKTERNAALAEARKSANLELQNKNAALMGAARNANAAKKELNAIRFQKEAALTKAATEKNAAVAEAINAARTAAMAETATEKAVAEQKLKNAQAKINAANANKAQALANAKTERNTALKRAMNNKQKAVNGLRANRNLKLQNKNAALIGAARNANAAKKELNAIRFQKEAALTKAATEKNAAVAEARNAARTAAMAETATEKAVAEQKLKNAQAKINAANANKAQALANAKTERNTALKRAMNNKQKAVNGLRANRNLKLQNKNAALMGAARNANAAKKELNAIREQKEAAIANAAKQKNAAVKSANNARKALVAGRFQSAAGKAVAEQKLKNAQAKINAANANKAQALANAAAEKIKANALAEEAARAKAAANKVAANAEILKLQRQNVQKRMANAKLASNRKLIQNKIVKVRKIMATYNGTNPFRKYTLVKQGEAAIKEFENGKLIDIENRMIELVRYAKTGNAEFDEGKRVARQTANATKQFEERKKLEAANREKARLARIETQKLKGQKVTLTRKFKSDLDQVRREKNDLNNKSAINAMKDASNKKVVSNLVSGALTKAVKSGPVSTIYQSTTNANRRMVKDKVEEKVEAKAYKTTWGIMIDSDGQDKTELSKLENKLNKKHVLRQDIRGLAPEAFQTKRLPGSGALAKTKLLTQVMRPYISGDDKYNEHKKIYNNAFKTYKNPAFGNTKSTKVNGMVTANNVMISMKRAPVPPPGVKPPNGRFRAIARAQIPPAKPSAMATAVQISMNKKRAVGNVALARRVYTDQGKFKRNMNIRRAAEGAAEAAKGKLARNATFRATGITQTTLNKADARRAQLAARKAAKKRA